MKNLLSRDEFRNGVFTRDKHKCVFCDLPAQDAHHILERRLWPDGGYYLDNGASVCEQHHIECEQTVRSVDEVREACGIKKKIIPPHLYDDVEYDKWGNIVLANGTRLRGDLFYDESVQKVLAGVLHLFTDKVKYPRTYHVPFSPGVNKDDRVLPNLDHFKGKRVIVTEKMDGENTTLYTGYSHARSIDSPNHPSRNWVKGFHSRFCGDIPEGWRICGENMYAKHSILYKDLKSYFYGFSMWDDKNVCFDWDTTLTWFTLLGIETVPVLYDGLFENCDIKNIHQSIRNERESEGWVIRTADSYSYGQFRSSVAKFVRKDHIQTVKHWMHGQAIEKNILIGE